MESEDKGHNLAGARALHYWQYGKYADNFDSMLLTLLQKADPMNRHKIRVSWPEIYGAWEEWNECESQDEYFLRYGLALSGAEY